jgi:hypothetical protein
MTALRARQMHGLYEYVARDDRAALARARAALDQAASIVRQREPKYRVAVERIAGWRPNPTAYGYTYLWPVHSLYFWWRDEGKAVDHPLSPCYLNLLNPAEVSFGEGFWTSLSDVLSTLLGFTGLGDCLQAPQIEPTFPQDGLRTRP